MKRFFALAVLFIATPVYPETQYNVVDLGTLSSWPSSSYAYSINNSGQIVGFAYNEDNNPTACLFNPSGENVELGTLSGYSQSGASSVNDAGQIVGGAGSPLSHSRALLYDSSGSGANVELGGQAAWSINNNGQVVGRNNNQAWLYDPSGGGSSIDLGTLGGDWGEAYANNDFGQIVGVAHSSDGSTKACLFDSSGQGNNINLGGLSQTGGTSYAYAINNSGLAVGFATIYESGANFYRACLFDLDNGNIDLGTLGGNESEAWSINDNSIIVGRAYTEESRWHACLFDSTGEGNNIDLNSVISPDLGWNLETARGVNSDGSIVGWGINPDGYRHGYLLTPVPEPTTILFLGLGGLLIRKR